MSKNLSDLKSEVSADAIKLALRQYVSQLKKDWKYTIPTFTLPGIGNILTQYAPPLVIAKIFTLYQAGEATNISDLWPYIMWLGGIWLAGEMVWRVAGQFFNAGMRKGVEDLYVGAMDSLLEKDLAFFHDNFSGSLTKRVNRYARSYEAFVGTLMFFVFAQLVPLVFIVYILWDFSPVLVSTLIGMTVITSLVATPLIKRRKVMVAEREAASNRVAGYVADIITNVDAVRAFGQEDYEHERHTGNVRKFSKKAKRTWDYHNLVVNMAISPLYVLTNMLGLAIAIWISQGTATGIETVFVTFSYYASFTHVMWNFNNIYRNIETHLSEAAQFTEMFMDAPKVTDPENAEPFAPGNPDIKFDNVSFFYEDSEGQHLFRNLDLGIKSGEKLALVGRSGGGKSTITKLILRFMDVQEGSIKIGGRDIKQIRQKDLRGLIAYVPQEPIMFHRTIAENIKYGRLDATEEEVEEAARMAHAAEFIDELPHGYDTLIGERGVKLSGGQRQRVAIARAIIRNAPILVLDEATSSLDSESERLIQDALKHLMEGRTAIVIAHRLSTIQNMDRIIVLNEGEIIEQGTHRELLKKSGQYAMLWSRQSGGFIEEEKSISST